MFGRSIRHCLGRLLDFGGRDSRDLFWPWAGTVLGIGMVAWTIPFAIQLAGLLGKVRQFARDHPDRATVESGPGYYSVQIQGPAPELMPDFGALMAPLLPIVIVMVLLLAAAVTRRLHDSNLRGWPALVPVALLANGLVQMQRLFAGMGDGREPDFGSFLLLFGNNLLYLATLGGLVFLLARRGTAGPNRWGDPAA